MPFINDRLAETGSAGNLSQTVTGGGASRFTFDPKRVSTLLRSRIVGQSEALSVVDDILYLLKADIGVPSRPLATVLFTGPTGVGKTEIVRVLAEGINGSADALCRIDMNTLSQAHYAAAFTGAPPGYVGSKEGYSLFDDQAISGSFSKPGIVLFDELEKADTDVVRSLLNVLDHGRLQLASGNKAIDFRNSLVFMTSNIGAREAAEMAARNATRGWRKWFANSAGQSGAELVDACMRQHFDPEFLNRIDCIVHFNSLDKKRFGEIVELELDKLRSRLSRRGVELVLEPGVLQFLEQKYEESFGARGIARLVRHHIEVPVARGLVEYPERLQVFIKCSRGAVFVE